MQTLDIEDLRNDPDRLDRVVQKSSDVDRFCSSSAWALSALEAFHPESTPRIMEFESGLVALTEFIAESERFLAPLESMWGLTCPILGPDPARISHQLCDWLLANRSDWQNLWFSGLRLGSPALLTLVERLGEEFPLQGCAGTASCITSLVDGMEGFLRRRSPRFRQNIRRLRRHLRKASIWFESPKIQEADRDKLFERILLIEKESWKGQQNEGIGNPSMSAFYKSMTHRLIPKNRLRVLFARQGDTDCGYIFGGLFDQEYRGLQMSYREDCHELGIGNALQLQMIETLSEEGVTRYDLGMAIDYKRRWSDEIQESVCLSLLCPQ